MATGRALKTLFAAALGKRLPIAHGELRLPAGEGPAAPLSIARDAHGIPHIRAENESDAWYGLGFCQGQDRAFQIESLIRVVRGTLSELVGPDGLAIDRLSRRIGFRRSAEAQLALLASPEREVIAGFVAGVNAGRKHGLRKPPHELALLRAAAAPMRGEDVLGLLGLTSFLLSSNWDAELARLKILELDGEAALAALDRPFPEWHPVTSPPATLSGPCARVHIPELAALREFLGTLGGSNNWAISPRKTRSGGAILANDPHLAPILPAQWYLAHLKTPTFEAAGACFAGAPGIVSGHNGRAAWGVTAGMVDNTDLYLEKISPDGRSVAEGDRFVECPRVREEIVVRGQKGLVVEDVLLTPRGPVIGPALNSTPHALSLAATWLQPRPVRGILALHRVSTFEELRKCFDGWGAMTLNFVYADQRGDIGWQLVGQPPNRRTAGSGHLPAPGWDARYAWEDELAPFRGMPHALNPSAGFIATANNRPLISSEIDLGEDWLDGYRVARIQEELAARDAWDVRATQRLQLDAMSIPWREMKRAILAALTAPPARPIAWEPVPGRGPGDVDDARYAAVRAELIAWSGEVAVDQPGAAVFEVFLHEFMELVVRAKAPRSHDWVMGQGFHFELAPQSMWGFRRIGWLSRLLRDQPAGWFPRAEHDRGGIRPGQGADHGADRSSGRSSEWTRAIQDAAAAAQARLVRKAGPSPRRWAWGRLRPLELRHPFGAKGILRPIFNLGPFPWGGDTNTVGQATVSPLDPFATPPAIANLRMTVDFGDLASSRFVLAGGQSGNPLSPHYGDLLELWKRGEGVPIAWTDDEVRASTVSTLRIAP